MRRRKRRRRRSFVPPIAATAGLVGTVFGGAEGGEYTVVKHIQDGDYNAALIRAVANLTGYHMGYGTWSISALNWKPVVMGGLVSAFIGGRGIPKILPFGLNLNSRLRGLLKI